MLWYIIAGVVGLCIGAILMRGRGHRGSIRPGEYSVHMLRPLGDRCIVVVARWETSLERQSFRTYALPLAWFDQNVNPFVGGCAVLMRVMRIDGKTSIRLKDLFPNVDLHLTHAWDRRRIPV